MKFLPLLALPVLCLTGCQTTYTRLTVTEFDGAPVSEWVAEGWVRKVDQGYAIRAVERHVAGPPPVTRRFPNGWRTLVVGANILREEIDKPAWLVALDEGETYLPAGESVTYEEVTK
jgi:hypothetical protein